MHAFTATKLDTESKNAHTRKIEDIEKGIRQDTIAYDEDENETGGATGGTQPVEMSRNNKLQMEITKRIKDPRVIMSFKSVNGKAKVPQEIEVIGVLNSKGLVNAE